MLKKNKPPVVTRSSKSKQALPLGKPESNSKVPSSLSEVATPLSSPALIGSRVPFVTCRTLSMICSSAE